MKYKMWYRGFVFPHRKRENEKGKNIKDKKK